MAQFSVAAAYNITYAPYVSDYSRYMPRKTLSRSLDLAAERSAIEASEAELQAIDVIAEAAVLAEHGHPDARQAAPPAELGQPDAQAPKDGN